MHPCTLFFLFLSFIAYVCRPFHDLLETHPYVPQGGTLESIAARAVAAAAEVAAAAAAAAAAATAAAEGGAPAVLDTAVKKEKGKGGPAPAWREQTLKRKRSFFEACESVPYYIRPLKVKQDIDRYSDR